MSEQKKMFLTKLSSPKTAKYGKIPLPKKRKQSIKSDYLNSDLMAERLAL
jgi:hypothetical protein